MKVMYLRGVPQSLACSDMFFCQTVMLKVDCEGIIKCGVCSVRGRYHVMKLLVVNCANWQTLLQQLSAAGLDVHQCEENKGWPNSLSCSCLGMVVLLLSCTGHLISCTVSYIVQKLRAGVSGCSMA